MVFAKFFAERSLNENLMNKDFEPYRLHYSLDAYNATVFELYRTKEELTYTDNISDFQKHGWYFFPFNSSHGFIRNES